MGTAAQRGHDPAAPERAEVTAPERPDLTAWRQRHALRRSNAARPIPSGRRYRRVTKHRGREQQW
ncbi:MULTISPECIES: hypothetical protein [unclassified Nocardia]|uniref:hypothetical protein n=1 Tax=unclassified Nocardia TaxID=2637762 RepID=UPI00278C4AFD|nr:MULTISPECIES: hypothetical protein [unclassified Nocardia]